MSWGYGKDNGPSTWVKQFALAGGQNQSPVNICSSDTVYDSKLAASPIAINYMVEQNMDLENTGQSVKANIAKPSTISGGPLGDTYQLAQFHLHWGCDKSKGSEHTIEGKKYASELHLVHWNRDKYSSFDEAANKEHGLAVFGIFLEEGDEHKGFKTFTDCLDSVKFTAKHEHVKGQFNPDCLLPKTVSAYWTYPGSLTTPPCYETVTWIVFRDVMQVSEAQMKSLRSLCRECAEDHIVDNYRPPCPLGTRKIKASFQS